MYNKLEYSASYGTSLERPFAQIYIDFSDRTLSYFDTGAQVCADLAVLVREGQEPKKPKGGRLISANSLVTLWNNFSQKNFSSLWGASFYRNTPWKKFLSFFHLYNSGGYVDLMSQNPDRPDFCVNSIT